MTRYDADERGWFGRLRWPVTCPRRCAPRSTSSPSPGRKRWPTRRSPPSSTRSCASTPALPSPLYEAERLSEQGRRPDPAQARGPQPHRRPQDPQRARPGAADQADGQDPGDRRDRRRPARRRQRHRRGVLRARLHRLHGRGRHPPPGAQRRPDEPPRRQGRARRLRQRHPQGRHQRGAARLGRQRRPHGVPLRYGGRPAPVPEHGPRLHPRHRRRGPRSSASTSSARCRTRSRPASAAAPTRSGCSPRSSTTRTSRSTASRPVATGVETGRHAATIVAGESGVLHGARTFVLQDEDGQTIESHSISAGPRLPRRRPAARPPRADRPGDVPARHRRRGDGRAGAAQPHRGDHPGDRVGARGRRRARRGRKLAADKGRTRRC